MAEFLLYEVWGGLMFNLPFLALSAFVGWKIGGVIAKRMKLEKIGSRVLMILVTAVVFLVLKSVSV